jgi:hypothetical protein
MNCKPIIWLCLCGFLFSCTERLICPAYQTALILDKDYRTQYFSPFTVYEGDTIPKMPYGFIKNKADDLDESFYAATEGKGFRIQRGSVYSQEKEGFVYNNRKSRSFITKIWSSPERAVLENPYLLDRILKKRPFYKMDILIPKLVHYGVLDSLRGKVVGIDSLVLDSLGQAPIMTETILTKPDGYRGYNIDQLNYNKKFGYLFPQPSPAPAPKPLDTLEVAKAANDSTETDSLSTKKRGIFGLFKKKGDKPPKEKKDKKNNDEGNKEEEEDK